MLEIIVITLCFIIGIPLTFALSYFLWGIVHNYITKQKNELITIEWENEFNEYKESVNKILVKQPYEWTLKQFEELIEKNQGISNIEIKLFDHNKQPITAVMRRKQPRIRYKDI
ncbi:hypothetical protein FACS1894172_09270 [Spirochaetia bacterium]|nr:hypothetical protein FACS1894164_11650 [Spirochaetia bacterium]GHU32515.1 hypothetical protein FACS1894172_09270 [Spirochaetia bacterium]